MDLFQAIFLGLLQGIFEWLPVSSQGQVMGVSLAFFGINAEQALRLAVFLHLGTFFAALFYFRKEILKILRLEEKRLGAFLLIALLSTAITGIPLYLLLKYVLSSFNPFFLLLLIGLLLVFTGLIQRKKKIEGKSPMNPRNAFFLGLGQGLSVLPGISRSGITTSVLLFEGFGPEKAFRLSFLLSVPSVLFMVFGFGLLEGVEINAASTIAFAVAAITGFLSIPVLLKIAKKINFLFFCILFGLLYGALALAYLT